MYLDAPCRENDTRFTEDMVWLVLAEVLQVTVIDTGTGAYTWLGDRSLGS
jgi:hypothetical protein